MGFGDWLEQVGDNIGGFSKDVASDIADTLGSDAQWVEENQAKQTAEETAEIAKEAAEEAAETAAEDARLAALTPEERIEDQKPWYSKTGTWIADTAAPAVWNVGAYVVAVTPIPPLGYLARGVESLTGTDLPDWAGGGLADRNRKAGEWAGGMGELIVDSPGRASALALQGVINAGSSTVGFVGDIGRAVVYEYTLHPLGAAVYNLGAAEGEEANLLSDRAFFEWTKGINDTLQVKKLFDDGSIMENKSLETAFDRVQPVILDENGKEIPNPHMTQEMTLLYGPQAVAEAFAFWAVGTLTAGVGGAALAALRATSVGERVVQVIMSVDTLADAALLIDKAAKAATKLSLAEEKLLGLNEAGAAIKQIQQAERAVQKAKIAFVKAETVAETAAATNATQAGKTLTTAEQQLEVLKTGGGSADDIAKAETALEQAKNAEIAAQELTQHTANLTDNVARAQAEEAIRQAAQLQATEATKTLSAAQSQVSELKAAGTSADDIANAEIALEQAKNAEIAAQGFLEQSTIKATQASEQATASSITINQVEQTFTGMEKIKNGFDAGIYKAGDRWLNPFFDTTARVTELGGAGLAFTMGVKSDLANAKTEVDVNNAMRESNADAAMARFNDRLNTYSTDEPTASTKHPQSLSESFNDPLRFNTPPPSYAGNGEGGITSTTFNNRVDGTTTTLDPAKPTIFTLTFDTPEDAQVARDTLGANK
ncbi:MAG: hypothetical protein COB14_06605 [Alphaproteobacteria bacterium]|nr:MAG: hypothetical protein COB14_06605 [Alphaproteobacteria bacterium]